MAYRRTTRSRKATGKKTTSTKKFGWSKKSASGAKKASTSKNTRVKVWSASEIAFLRKEYRSCTNGMLAKKLRRSVASVRAKAGSLKLNKTSNFLSLVARTAGSGGWARAGQRVMKSFGTKGRR